MKRYGNLFKQIYDINNLEYAYSKAKKGKGWYNDVVEFDKNKEENLSQLRNTLITNSYKTSEYEIFEKRCGNKIREIYKLPFYPDRICQWAIILIIEPYFIKHFTKDTYSAIPNRGIHLALKRAKKELKHDYDNMTYCLKIDINKYYPNINHDVLKFKLSKLFKDKQLLNLLYEIIDSYPSEVGIPIGNYTSQYFGNFYLSEFDHWIKEEKRVKHYFRYMDDMIFFSNSKEELHQLRKEIAEYLDINLKLKLKSNWQVFNTEIRGVDFVGYVIRKDYVLIRKSIKENMKLKLKNINKENITESDICMLNSYNGWLKHANTTNLRKTYLDNLLQQERMV